MDKRRKRCATEVSFMELGSTVKVVYTGTLKDGTVFGTATEEKPLEFQTGMEKTIPGFEREVMTMEVGDKRTFTLEAADGFGEYDEEQMLEVPTVSIPYDVEVGKTVWMADPMGQRVPTKVAKIEDGVATLDCNHPLAGEPLSFEVELIAVEPAPEGFISMAERRKKMAEQQAMLSGGQGMPGAPADVPAPGVPASGATGTEML